ncbi:unnamed protein product [Brassica rapa subsp. trilocularis]
MFKPTFKPNGMRVMSLIVINKELGNVTDIDNIILTKYLHKESICDEIMEDEDDVHEPDLVVDSWDKRLDEGFSVFLKDMYKENVSAREEHRE